MATITNSGKTIVDNGNGTSTITYANEAQARANGVTSGLTRTVSNNNSTFQSAVAADTKPASTTSTVTTSSSVPKATTNSTASSSYAPTSAQTIAQKSVASGLGDTGAANVGLDQYNDTMKGWQMAGTGATGKTYSVSNGNNSIQVQYKDGSVRTVTPGMADYNTTVAAMQQDLQSKGINYTPTISTERYIPTYDISKVLSGEAERGERIDDTYQKYQTVNYLMGNEDLQKAYRDYAASTGYKASLNDYIDSLYANANSKDELNNLLNGYGLSDYNTDNAIYTVSGHVVPGGNAAQYGYSQNNQYAGSGSNGDSYGNYYTYGGQSYLTGGDAGNFIQYVNGKTGNWTPLDYMLGNAQNNPYVMGDSNLYNAYQQGVNYYGANNGSNGTTNGTYSGSYTGNTNVDNVINYINSAGNYAQQTGNNDLLKSIQDLLNNGLTATQDWLAQQRNQANTQAENQSRAAWVNSQLAQQALNESYSAAGLGTTGALQSGLQGINTNYGNNIANINSNLTTLLSNLNEQELQALSDYYNNLGRYTVDITQDEMNRQQQAAQMAMQQEQFRQNQALAQQELAWKQQQAAEDAAWREREYADGLAQQAYGNAQSDRDYAWKLISSGVVNQALADAAGLSLAEAQSYAASALARQK